VTRVTVDLNVIKYKVSEIYKLNSVFKQNMYATSKQITAVLYNFTQMHTTQHLTI